MRKLLSIISCLFLILSVFTVFGCAKKDKAQESILVWHWMTDRDAAFQELAKKYEEQTGIKIKIDLYAPSDVYAKKITASAQARVLPDIYGILDIKQFFASYIKNGFVENLTDAFEANDGQWAKRFFIKALDTNRFLEGNIYGVKPGIYGVPLDVTNQQMLYNKKLLKEAGVKKLPETFEEFLQAMVALKRVGISGFVSGWGEPWMIECFASNYAFNIMGEEKVMDTMKGDIPYTDPDWIKVFDVFRQMRDKGVFIEGIVTKGNKFAEQDFALERAAFAFNGSWCVNVYEDMNPHLDYAPMIPPPVNLQRPMSIWGGAGSSFVVNGRSVNKQKAIDFLKWLTAKEQQVFLAKETKNLPAVKDAVGDLPEILAGFAKGMDYSTHPRIWKYNESPIVTERITRGIQSILIGDKTPQEVAQEIQTVKEKVLERERQRKK